MPTAASGSNSPFWYSYNYGNVHFIAFSIEQPYNQTDPQGIWLMNDILEASRAENRIVRPWIVAYAHRPMWCSNTVSLSHCIHILLISCAIVLVSRSEYPARAVGPGV